MKPKNRLDSGKIAAFLFFEMKKIQFFNKKILKKQKKVLQFQVVVLSEGICRVCIKPFASAVHISPAMTLPL